MAFYKAPPLEAKPGTAGTVACGKLRSHQTSLGQLPLGLHLVAGWKVSWEVETGSSFFFTEFLLRTSVFEDCMRASGMKAMCSCPRSLRKGHSCHCP